MKQNSRFFLVIIRQLSKIFITLSLLAVYACGYDQSYSSSQDSYSRFVATSCEQENSSYLPDNIKLNVPYLVQEYNYCGPASLSMVMQHYGFNISQEDLGQGLVNQKGVTTSSLVKRAEVYGFSAYVSSCSFYGLLSILAQGSPAIVRTINSTGNNGHFIVVTGYDTQLGLVYINDPDKPYKSYDSFEDFQRLWDIKGLGEENSQNLTLVFYPSQLI
jgi:hypothetical protein